MLGFETESQPRREAKLFADLTPSTLWVHQSKIYGTRFSRKHPVPQEPYNRSLISHALPRALGRALTVRTGRTKKEV
jgi:hypothetical protein